MPDGNIISKTERSASSANLCLYIPAHFHYIVAVGSRVKRKDTVVRLRQSRATN